MLKAIGIFFVVFLWSPLAYSYEVFYCTDKKACQGKKVIYHNDFIDAIRGLYGVIKEYREPFRDDSEDVEHPWDAPEGWSYDLVPKEDHIRFKTYGGNSMSIALRIYKDGRHYSKLEFICYGGIIETDYLYGFCFGDDCYEEYYRFVCADFAYYVSNTEKPFDFYLEGKDPIYDWLQENLPEDREKVSIFGRKVFCKGDMYDICFE